MSSNNPPRNPLDNPPPRQPLPPPRPRGSGPWGVLFALSFVLNLVLLAVVCGGLFISLVGAGTPESSVPLTEKLYAGSASSSDKVAVIKVDGVLLEGTLNFVHRQIDQAAKDSDVKAVVLRINSPGGSITASDDLYRRLVELRDGNTLKGTIGKKHLVVSMGSVAASGGYYISMAGSPLFAEKTTATGSIGIYAAFPNVEKLADKYGVQMVMIKRGEVKGSGSLFKEMNEQERNVWEDSIDQGYRQFLEIVETGRPELKGKLLDRTATTYKNEQGQEVKYTRYIADGGVYYGEKAKEANLIDTIGGLDDAIQEAKKAAALPADAKVITYREPFALSELFSVQASQPKQAELAILSSAASPKLWYLAPGYELSGVIAARPNREILHVAPQFPPGPHRRGASRPLHQGRPARGRQQAQTRHDRRRGPPTAWSPQVRRPADSVWTLPGAVDLRRPRRPPRI